MNTLPRVFANAWLIEPLAQLFPKTTQLIVRCNDPEIDISSATTKMVCDLLRQWPVVEFSLWRGGYFPILDAQFLPSICSTINHYLANTLKCLDLYITSHGRDYQDHPSVDLSNVLPRLERLRLRPANGAIPLSQIEQLNGTKVKEITLNNSQLWSKEEQDRFYQRNPALMANLTRLNLIRFKPFFYTLLDFICDHFVSLQFVQLQCDSDSKMYLRQLSKLPNLTELKMHDFEVDTSVPPHLSLPTVKKLTLCDEYQLICYESPFDSEPITMAQFWATLAAQFPCLETLVIVCDEGHEEHRIDTNIAQVASEYFVHLKKLKIIMNSPEWQNSMDAFSRTIDWSYHHKQ